MKSKKEFDWYQPLQLASQPEVAFTPMADALKLCSLMLLQVNKIQKRNQPKPPELVEEKKAANVFDINIARQADTECYLPGGQKVFITNFIGPSLISKWVGKTIENALESAILDLIEVLREKDHSWLLYSAADSSRTKYLRIEDNFFETFGRVLIAGFGLTAESLSETIANIRTKISSQIDRKREKRNPDLKQNLETFRNLLAK
uniref:Uncharacterized protein n=1 Tax=Caenorhabditis japonica TaxID=281687 RepID=A0A8R1I3R3_CAEJA